jgi:glycosyltransferase involved in cell wall biosynthesis
MDEVNRTYILINSLGGGGAERQVSYIAQLERIDKVLCIEPWVQYQFPEDKLVILSAVRSKQTVYSKLFMMLKAILALRKLGVNKQTHLICFLQLSLLVGLICKFLFRCKLTLSIRVNPFMHSQNKQAFSLSNNLLRIMLKRADYVIPNSTETAADIRQHFPELSDKVRTIINGYDLKRIQQKSLESNTSYQDVFLQKKCLLSVGRTDRQKGQWHLIRIMPELLKHQPDSALFILGEGEILDDLIRLAESLKLLTFVQGRDELHAGYQVYFTGFQSNPYVFYAHAKLFLFPSLYEGLPNALIESFLCNTPALSTNCKSGPQEIMLPDAQTKLVVTEPMQTPYGFLMPVFDGEVILDDKPLTMHETMWLDTIVHILKHPDLLHSMSVQCDDMKHRYDFQTVGQLWNNLILEGSSASS